MPSQSVAVTWEQYEPAFPSVDCAVRVGMLSLAEGLMLGLSRHPDSFLLPLDQWPSEFANTRLQAASEEYCGLICRGFFKKNMGRPLKRDELFEDTRAVPLDSGIIGVATGKLIEDGLAFLLTVFNFF